MTISESCEVSWRIIKSGDGLGDLYYDTYTYFTELMSYIWRKRLEWTRVVLNVEGRKKQGIGAEKTGIREWSPVRLHGNED